MGESNAVGMTETGGYALPSYSRLIAIRAKMIGDGSVTDRSLLNHATCAYEHE
jgi:hypothetical protein